MIYGDPRKGWGIRPQMVEQPRWSAVREPPASDSRMAGQQGSGTSSRGAGQSGVDSHAGSARATAPVGQIWDSPRSLLLQLAPWLSSAGDTGSAVPQSTAGLLGVCVCSDVGGGWEAATWTNEGAGRWDRHEETGAGERAFPKLWAWPEAKHRDGHSMWWTQNCVGATTQGWGCWTHITRGSLASWASVSPQDLSRWPKAPQRRREPCPLALGPWEGSAYFPLACQPALRFSSSAFSQHNQAVSWD